MGYCYKILPMALIMAACSIGFSPNPTPLEAKAPLTQPKVTESDDVALRVYVRYGNDRGRHYYRRGYHKGHRYRHYPYGRYHYYNRGYPYYRQHGHHYRYYPRRSGFTIYYGD